MIEFKRFLTDLLVLSIPTLVCVGMLIHWIMFGY